MEPVKNYHWNPFQVQVLSNPRVNNFINIGLPSTYLIYKIWRTYLRCIGYMFEYQETWDAGKDSMMPQHFLNDDELSVTNWYRPEYLEWKSCFWPIINSTK